MNENQNVTFTCKAVGIPPPSIYWTRGVSNLTDRVVVGDPEETSVPYKSDPTSGSVYEVTRRLTLLDVVDGDSDMGYACVAVNVVGSNETEASDTQSFELLVRGIQLLH